MSVIIDYAGTHVLICKAAVEDVYAAYERYRISVLSSLDYSKGRTLYVCVAVREAGRDLRSRISD
jgi:hypothetical protein